MPTDFKRFLDLDSFSKLMDAVNDGQGKKAFDLAVEGIAKPAFLAFMQEKADKGEISPIVEPTLSFEFMHAWNAVFEPENAPYRNYHLHRLLDDIFVPMLFYTRFSNKAPSLSHDALCKDLTDGNVKCSVIPSFHCSKSGIDVRITLDGWNPVLMEIDSVTIRPVPLERPKALGLCVDEVEFKSGRILVADWFRIPAFTSLSKSLGEFDICCDLGRQQQASAHAKAGIVSVCVGNSSPNILFDGKNIVVASCFDHDLGEDTDPAILSSFTDVGRCCTDLWNVTAVDFERICEIVAAVDSVPMERAREIVEEYVAENDVNTVNAAPGTMFLSHMGNHHDLAANFKTENIHAPSERFPYLVISAERPVMAAQTKPSEQKKHTP